MNGTYCSKGSMNPKPSVSLFTHYMRTGTPARITLKCILILQHLSYYKIEIEHKYPTCFYYGFDFSYCIVILLSQLKWPYYNFLRTTLLFIKGYKIDRSHEGEMSSHESPKQTRHDRHVAVAKLI